MKKPTSGLSTQEKIKMLQYMSRPVQDDTATPVQESTPTVPTPAPQIDTQAPVIPGPLTVSDEPTTPHVEPQIPGPLLPEPTPSAPAPAPIIPQPLVPTGLEKAKQDLGSAFEQEKQAVSALGSFTEQEAEERKPLMEQRTKVLETYNNEYEKIIANAAGETKADNERIDKLVEEQQNSKYDGFWQNKSTGEKILGAISIALGAYAQGVSGGKVPNTALSIINDAMKADYTQYLDKSNKKIALINQSRTSVAAKQAATREELLRQEAYKIGQLGQIEAKLQDIGVKFQGKRAGETANQLASQIEQRKVQLQSGIQQQIEANKAADAKLKADALQSELDRMTKKQEKQEKTELDYAKENRKVRSTLEKAETSLKTLEKAPNTSAGDIVVLFNFIKAQDPNSTVRESEFQLGIETEGVLERISGIIPGWTAGKRLTDTQRAELIKAARSSVQAQKEVYKQYVEDTKKEVTRFGLNPTKIFGSDNQSADDAAMRRYKELKEKAGR